MIKLRVLELLEEQGHSKYWLHSRMDLSYQNLSKLVNNQTTSIRFENIEKLCKVLGCNPNELFEIISDEKENT